MNGRPIDECIDCDHAVRVNAMGWYRCDYCGYESLRHQHPSMPPDVLSDYREQASNPSAGRSPALGLSLYSISDKQ